MAAAFSDCGRYRWWLERVWRPAAPRLLFVGLNPSRADGTRDDPTLRRLVGFAAAAGYGAVEVVNLCAWVAADPAALARCADPVGAANEGWIRHRLRLLAARSAPEPAAVWLGWGNRGAAGGRGRRLVALVGEGPVRFLCLGVTAAGEPRHPLYCPGGLTLRPFAPSWGGPPADPPGPCRAFPVATRSICT